MLQPLSAYRHAIVHQLIPVGNFTEARPFIWRRQDNHQQSKTITIRASDTYPHIVIICHVSLAAAGRGHGLFTMDKLGGIRH